MVLTGPSLRLTRALFSTTKLVYQPEEISVALAWSNAAEGSWRPEGSGPYSNRDSVTKQALRVGMFAPALQLSKNPIVQPDNSARVSGLVDNGSV